MIKFKRKKNTYQEVVLVIFLLGFILRLIKPTFGSPILYITGDEAPNYLGALYMIAKHNLLEDVAIYPPFGSYIQIPFLLLAFIGMFIVGRVHSILELKLFLLSNQGYFLFIPRIISGLFGGLTLFVLYRTVVLLFPNKSRLNLITVFLFAFSFNHIQVSNSGRPWALTIFFFSLCVLFTLKSILIKDKEKRNCYFAALFSIISYGFHQVGIFALWFFIIIRILNSNNSFIKSLKNKLTIVGVCISFTGILLITYVNSFGPQTGLFRDIGYYSENYSIFLKLADILINNHIFAYAKQLIYTETLVFILFIFSFFTILVKKKLLQSIFIYIISSYLIVGHSFSQTRYMLPVIFLMSIFAALIFDEFIILTKSSLIRFSLIIFIISIHIFPLLLWISIYLNEPTFMQATKWINNNIKPEEVIASTAIKYVSFVPSKTVIPLQQKTDSGFYQELGYLLNEGEFPSNVRNIIFIGKVGNQTVENAPEIIEKLPLKPSYLLNLYWSLNDNVLKNIDKDKYRLKISFSPFRNNSSLNEINNILATINNTPLFAELIKLNRSGPYVDIYEKVTTK